MIRFDPPLSRMEKAIAGAAAVVALLAGYACGLAWWPSALEGLL